MTYQSEFGCVLCGFEQDSNPLPLLLLCGLYPLQYPLHLFMRMIDKADTAADIIRTKELSTDLSLRPNSLRMRSMDSTLPTKFPIFPIQPYSSSYSIAIRSLRRRSLLTVASLQWYIVSHRIDELNSSIE
jgi:hypothetical protein